MVMKEDSHKVHLRLLPEFHGAPGRASCPRFLLSSMKQTSTAQQLVSGTKETCVSCVCLGLKTQAWNAAKTFDSPVGPLGPLSPVSL